MTPEYLAKEADLLLSNPVLKEALRLLKQDALDKLINCDPTATEQIIGLQVTAKMADEIQTGLRRFILAQSKYSTPPRG